MWNGRIVLTVLITFAIIVSGTASGAVLRTSQTADTNNTVSTTINWTRAVDGEITDMDTDGDTIYVASGDTIHAFNASSGNKLWQETLPTPDFVDIKSISVDGSYLTARDNDFYENLYAVDLSTGNYIWQEQFDNDWFSGTVANETVFTAVDTGFGETTYQARHAQNGTIKWKHIFQFDVNWYYTFGDENYLSNSNQIVRYDHSNGLQYKTGDGSQYLPIPLSERLYAFSDSDIQNDEFTPHLIIYDRETGVRETAVSIDHQAYHVQIAVNGTNRLFALLDNGEENEVVGYDKESGTREYTLSPDEDLTKINANGQYLFGATTNGDLLFYNQSDETRLAKRILGSSKAVGLLASPDTAIIATKQGNIYSVSIDSSTDDGSSDDDSGDSGDGTDDNKTDTESKPLLLNSQNTTTAPNSTATITYNVTNVNGSPVSGLAIDIGSLPADWTIKSQSADGATWSSNETTWLWLQRSDGQSAIADLKLQIPNSTDPGEYTITATVSSGKISERSMTAQVTVTESGTQTVEQAVKGSDGSISITEIQQAILWWASDQEVPNTGGKKLGITKLQSLIQQWASGS